MKPCLFIADDDDDDKEILKHALGSAKVQSTVVFVSDGEELLNRILMTQQDSEINTPILVMLDLNMPKMSGLEVLKEMKSNPALRSIPVIIFSTSDYEKDVNECYALGAASYIVKPANYAKLVSLLIVINSYWLDVVLFPRK